MRYFLNSLSQALGFLGVGPKTTLLEDRPVIVARVPRFVKQFQPSIWGMMMLSRQRPEFAFTFLFRGMVRSHLHERFSS